MLFRSRYTIYGMLMRMGFDVIDMGVIRDDPALIETACATTGCWNSAASATG